MERSQIIEALKGLPVTKTVPTPDQVWQTLDHDNEIVLGRQSLPFPTNDEHYCLTIKGPNSQQSAEEFVDALGEPTTSSENQQHGIVFMSWLSNPVDLRVTQEQFPQ